MTIVDNNQNPLQINDHITFVIKDLARDDHNTEVRGRYIGATDDHSLVVIAKIGNRPHVAFVTRTDVGLISSDIFDEDQLWSHS